MSLSPTDLAVAFAAGFVSFVSPCVWPLLPGYLSFVSGVPSAQLGDHRRRVTLAACGFVAGFTAVFTLAGAGVGVLGSAVPRPPARAGAGGGITGDRDGGADAASGRVADPQQLEAAGAVGAARPGRGGGGRRRLRDRLDALHRHPAGGDPGHRRQPRPGRRGSAAAAGLRLGLGVPFIIAGVWLPSVLATTRGLRNHWDTVTRVSGAVLIVAGVLLASGRLTDLTARLAG